MTYKKKYLKYKHKYLMLKKGGARVDPDLPVNIPNTDPDAIYKFVRPNSPEEPEDPDLPVNIPNTDPDAIYKFVIPNSPEEPKEPEDPEKKSKNLNNEKKGVNI